MVVRKLDDGRWLAEVYVNFKRIRKKFKSKVEANKFYNLAKNNALFSIVDEKQESALYLSDLVRLWFDLHGQTLVKGKQNLKKLLAMCEAMGNPLASRFSADHFAEYRKKRLNGEILFSDTRKIDKAKPSTINIEQILLGSVFNELKRLKKWNGENPLDGVRRFRQKENEVAFLREDEIKRLLVACENSRCKDLKLAVTLALSTGARWGEICNLTASNVVPFKVTFTKTKGGRNRTVPISPDLYSQIEMKQGLLFDVSFQAFAAAAKAAGIDLPALKSTHILRHTFASHFMMNGGNILVLKEILGHSKIETTMIYAHFAPSYLETAVSFNPISKMAI